MVDEEQTEHLDMLAEQLALTLQMGADGFTNLNTTDIVFVHAAHGIAFMQSQAVEEADDSLPAVYAFYDEVVVIFGKSATLLLQVEAFIHEFAYLFCSGLRLDVEADASLWIALADDDFLQIDVAVGGGTSYLSDTLHLNLLHQFLVVGIDGIQLIHHIIYITLTVGGAIQKGKEGLEHGNTLTGLVLLIHTQYRLRFIDNHDRMGLCQHVDRTAGAELITSFEDDAGGLISFLQLAFLHLIG